jgi:anti-anti-sigma factor
MLGSKDIRELEIDLGKVEYLDSSALGMLLLLRERAENSRKRVMLSNCRGTVKQVLDIANFGKLFRIT